MLRRTRHNSDRQENTLTPKVYTPLQFENSLGKLQCGSVMAPRKIIDMDVVSCDKVNIQDNVWNNIKSSVQNGNHDFNKFLSHYFHVLVRSKYHSFKSAKN